jgi:hypothetical protein
MNLLLKEAIDSLKNLSQPTNGNAVYEEILGQLKKIADLVGKWESA